MTDVPPKDVYPHEGVYPHKGVYTYEGHRRLKAALGWTGLILCAVPMAIVLVVYGMPYNPIWWGVMALILLFSFLLPQALARVIEWIANGYLDKT
jgi:hypothetical protein